MAPALTPAITYGMGLDGGKITSGGRTLKVSECLDNLVLTLPKAIENHS